MCDNNDDNDIEFQVWKYNLNGDHKMMHEFSTTNRKMVNHKKGPMKLGKDKLCNFQILDYVCEEK